MSITLPSRWILSVTVMIVLSRPATLWAERYSFKLYGEEAGLNNLAVQALQQDAAGFIWVGTQNGLFRYDGWRFVTYDASSGLPSARIESLHLTANGVLWVGTRAGLARRIENRFEPVPLQVARGVSGRGGIGSDEDGTVYVATEKGLVYGRPSSDSHYNFRLARQPGGDAVAYGVYVDPVKRGTVWYGCGKQVCRFERGSVQTLGADAGVPADAWGAFFRDTQGTLWVRGPEHLLRSKAGDSRFELVPEVAGTGNLNPALTLDRTGRILVPSYRGLYRGSGSGWELISARDGLPSPDISSMLQDREGSMWLGMLGSGLGRWLGYSDWKSWTAAEGLIRDSVWSIARDPEGKLWAGTPLGLSLAEVQDERTVWQPVPIPGLGVVRALAAGVDGGIWLGADPGGVQRVDRATRQVRQFGKADGLLAEGVMRLAFDASHDLWVASRQGLFVSDGPIKAGGGAPHFHQVKPVGTAPDETFFTVEIGPKGSMWAGGSRGLAVLKGGTWRRYTVRDGLRSDTVGYLAPAHDGSIWVGYREAVGLSRVRIAGTALQVESFGTSHGLKSNKILFLRVDRTQRLWVGTDRGVDLLESARWRHLGRGNGLIWEDCNSNAVFEDGDGSVWFGTSRGLSRYRAPAEPGKGQEPAVVITAAHLGDVALNPSIWTEVSHKEDSLTVSWAALTFINEPAVIFKYRLTDLAPQWVKTTQRELNYSRMPPGQYTLEVMARNATGVWSDTPARLSFEILIPWWESWWFRLLAVIEFGIFGWVIWQQRLSRLVAEHERLENAVTERTSELLLEQARALAEKARVEEQNREIERLLEEAQQASRLKSEFLANMSHEIRTPMNGVLGMTDLVLGTHLSDEQREYLHAARTSASSLLILLNDILDFSKVEANRLDLDPMPFTVRDPVLNACKTLSLKAEEKGLRITIAVEADVPEVVVGDALRVQQVLLNLLGNAVKFTSEGGIAVAVKCERTQDRGLLVRFSVTDTGIGIPEDKQKIIFELFRQADGSHTRRYGGTGLGLAISSRLAKLMGGDILVESSPGRGSTFHFLACFGAFAPAPVDATTDMQELRIQQASVGAKRKLRILLAEDNRVNQVVATRMLQRCGHEVRIASNGLEALALHASEPFDVVLMDVQMPEMDGFEATSGIRERDRVMQVHTPIVAMTAHAMIGDREKCLNVGMDAYITKPLDAALFLRVVEQAAGDVPADEISPADETSRADEISPAGVTG